MRNLPNLTDVVLEIDASGCAELPFVNGLTQQYFNYVNGVSGYIVFALGTGALLIGMVSKSRLATMPSWVAGVVIAALAVTSLPAVLPVLGIELGCGNEITIEEDITDMNNPTVETIDGEG